MKKRLTNDEFIGKAKEVHGEKYDYSFVDYKGNKVEVCILCPKHGKFWQMPYSHLRGAGCKKCAIDKNANRRRLTTEEFIKKAIEIHGNKYDYSKVDYDSYDNEVCILCPKHGEFWQLPYSHLRGAGCKKCSDDKRRLTTEEFIKKAIEIHGNKYDYSKVKYAGCDINICIICSKHGEFLQTPSKHLSGSGCNACGNEIKKNSQKLTLDEFIEKSKEIHSDKYDYSKVEYINNRTDICIICPKHGEFPQSPDHHLRGQGCPRCSIQMSKAEDDIMKLLHLLNPQQRNHSILNGKEIDIYIPSLKLGIEYNGLRWHSEQFGKDAHYHIDKLNECNEKGIRLIQIFEDEWVNHREICEGKLRQICGLNHNLPKIFARKCTVREITNNEAKLFLDKNHIQGFSRSTVYLGCYSDNNLLIGVMSFKREHEEGYWDLNRFATDINYQCIGVGGKLFKHFIEHYDYKRIKSFADRRWTINPTDNIYTKLGFEFVEFTKPDYRYVKNNRNDERCHKFGFRKQILYKKYGLPLSMTEYEMTKELSFYRIWDCGLIRYQYTKHI